MHTEQFYFIRGADVLPKIPARLGDRAQLVLVFGATERLAGSDVYGALRGVYPRAVIAGCSTAGEILDQASAEDSVTVTAMAFDTATVRGVSEPIRVGERSEELGRRLAGGLPPDGLRHVLVISDGLEVNGSALVAGLTAGLPASVSLSGGLSADGERFARTLVLLDGPPAEGRVAAVGFYGERLGVACGCASGWTAFGPERMITRARDNVLYELDGRPALDLYRRYLAEAADAMPAAGLRFPLLVRSAGGEPDVVRTILSVDEKTGGMTYAGDVPQGARAFLMKANADRLIDGAGQAAQDCVARLGGRAPQLAVLISCVGRKMALRPRVDEEIEAVRYALGGGVAMTGLYSYGEIASAGPGAPCGLHNQTMTITAFTEI